MTRFPLRHVVLLAAALLLAPAAFAEKTAGERVDDTTLATSVKGALVDSDEVSAGHINVETYKGVVQLGGFVESEQERSAAIAAAGKVQGAVSVLDAMVVLTGSRTFGQTVADTEIQTKLKTKLATSEGIEKAVRINTEVKQGHILLTGFVAKPDQKAKAGEIAHGIADVKQVHNLISMKPE